MSTLSESNTKILVIIPKELKDWTQSKAAQENRSMSNYIVNLIQQERAKDQSADK